MWIYEKRLQYPVKIATPNAALAKLIAAQYGGPHGSLLYFKSKTAPSTTIAAGIEE